MTYGKFSGMTVAEVVPAADGSTQAFVKVTAANQVGDQAAEGDIFRAITNKDAALTMYIGETVANANAAIYPLRPGETFTLLGPSGVGWKGDLYIKGDGAAKAATMRF